MAAREIVLIRRDNNALKLQRNEGHYLITGGEGNMLLVGFVSSMVLSMILWLAGVETLLSKYSLPR